jgi:hypothetical protein
LCLRAARRQRILTGVASASCARALTLLLGLALGSTANAEQPAVSSAPAGVDEFLVWNAPRGCATADSVSARVKELLGESILDRTHVQRVGGRVTHERDGWALDLELMGRFGKRERHLEADTCGDLAEAAAMAITLAFEAARAGEDAAASPAPAAPDATASDATAGDAAAGGTDEHPLSEPPQSIPPSGAAASPGEAAGAATPMASSAGLRLRVGVEIVGDVTSLPSLAPGVSLVARVRATEWDLAAYGLWLPGLERALEPGQSVRFALLGAGVRGCYRLGQGLLDTALCAGLEAGRLSAEGVGLQSAERVSDLWLTPHVGLELRAEVSRSLGLYVRGEAIAPLFRQKYAVNDNQSVHRVAALGVRGAAGVMLGF